GDEGGHDVDLEIGKGGQGAIEADEIGDESDDGAEVESAAGGLDAAPAINGGDGERSHEAEADEKNARVSGHGHADLADAIRLAGKNGGFLFGASEDFADEGAGDVEALDHEVVHLGGAIVAFAGEGAHLVADAAGGPKEDGHGEQSDGGEAPGEGEHGRQDEGDGDEIADGGGEEVGEGVADAVDIAVEAADEGAGAGAAEKGERHFLNVLENADAEVKDDFGADERGKVALAEGEAAVNYTNGGGQDREHDDEMRVVPENAVVDELAIDEGVDDADRGVEHDEEEKEGERAGIRADETPGAAHRAGGQLVLEDFVVLAKDGEHGIVAAAHRGCCSGMGRELEGVLA